MAKMKLLGAPVIVLILSLMAHQLLAQAKQGKLNLQYDLVPLQSTINTNAIFVLTVRNTAVKFFNRLEAGESITILIPDGTDVKDLVTDTNTLRVLSLPDANTWQSKILPNGIQFEVIGDGFDIGSGGGPDDTFAFAFMGTINSSPGIAKVEIDESDISKKKAKLKLKKKAPTFNILKTPALLEVVSQNTTDDEAALNVVKLRVKNASGSADIFSVDSEGDVVAHKFIGDGSQLTGEVNENRIPDSITRDTELAAHTANPSAHHTKTTDASEIVTGTMSGDRIDGGTLGTVNGSNLTDLNGANITQETVGSDQIANIDRPLPLSIASFKPIPALPGPTFVSTGDNGQFGAWRFSDDSTQRIVTTLPLPTDVAPVVGGGLPLAIDLYWVSETQTQGTVVWNVFVSIKAPGDNTQGITQAPLIQGSVTAVNTIVKSSGAVTPSKGVGDEIIGIAIERLGTHGNDTLVGDALLLGVRITYPAAR